MREYRLLIFDADDAYVAFLTHRFSDNAHLKIVGSSNDGIQAMALLQSVAADIILMNPGLPGIDGLTLLKHIARMKTPPVTVCLSEFYSNVFVELLRRNGADYFACKPIDHDSLSTILVECAETAREQKARKASTGSFNENSEIHHRIYTILYDHGFSSRHSGTHYIANAAAKAFESPLLMRNLSSELYTRIAENSNVSVSCIERCMRTAISSADSDGRLSKAIGSAPTNKTCIQYVLYQLNNWSSD